MLVWEPRRVVPTYAVPAEDLKGKLVASGSLAPAADGRTVSFAIPDVTELRVFDPRVPFGVRLTDGEPVEVRVVGSERSIAAFRPSDSNLAGYVILDFDGFDTWLEEDDQIVSHPRDPFHRVDIRNSSRHVQLSLDNHVLADSTRTRMVFETLLPVRYYIPRADVLVPLEPRATRTRCAYKGEASYWSVNVAGRVVDDLAWSYEDPFDDASALHGHVAFFDERMDLVVDGSARARPVTPWS